MLAVALPVFVNPIAVDAFTQPKATLVGVSAALLLAAWSVEGVFEGRFRLPKTPVDIPIAIYFACLGVATLFSTNYALSLFGPYKWREGFFYLLCYGVIFYGAVTYLRGQALRRALIWGGMGAALVSVYAIAQRLGFDFTQWFANSDPTRAFSTLGNPVYLGAYALLVTPVAAGLALASPAGSRDRALSGAVAGLSAVALAVSYSRGAWLGLVMAALVLLACAPRRKTVAVWMVALLVTAIIAAAIPVPGQSQGFLSRVASAFSAAGSNAPRLALWRGAVTLIGQRPLVGVGPEAFKEAFARVKPPNWPAIDPEDKSARAHNDLLHVAATAGIPAALAYLAVLLLLVGRAAWVLLSPRGRIAAFGSADGHEGRRTLIAGMLAALVGYLFYMQFEFTMIEVTPLFWMTAGALVAGSGALGTRSRTREADLPEVLSGPGLAWAWLAIIATAFLIASSVFVRPAVADVYFGEALQDENGGSMPAAVVDLRTALWWAPNEDYYHFFLGKAYVIAAQQENMPVLIPLAISAYEKALLLNRADPTLYNAIGSAYYASANKFGKTDDYARAEYYYKRSLVYDPTNPEAVERLGQVAFYTGKYALAVSYFEQATRLVPDRSSYYFNLGTGYENLGALTKAETAYETAVRLAPDDAQAKQVLAALKRHIKAQKARRR